MSRRHFDVSPSGWVILRRPPKLRIDAQRWNVGSSRGRLPALHLQRTLLLPRKNGSERFHLPPSQLGRSVVLCRTAVSAAPSADRFLAPDPLLPFRDPRSSRCRTLRQLRGRPAGRAGRREFACVLPYAKDPIVQVDDDAQSCASGLHQRPLSLLHRSSAIAAESGNPGYFSSQKNSPTGLTSRKTWRPSGVRMKSAAP
jgi:hypothetical protein